MHSEMTIRVRKVADQGTTFAYAKNHQQNLANVRDVQLEENDVFDCSDFSAVRYTLKQNGAYLTNTRGEPIHLLKVSYLGKGEDDDDFEAANDNVEEFAHIIEAAPGTVYALEPTAPNRSQIELFVLVLFKYITVGNWVSLRAFFEGRA